MMAAGRNASFMSVDVGWPRDLLGISNVLLLLSSILNHHVEE